ncbi:hypothetical protein pb186bvf_007941 [Paramecium bursaria]
MLFLINIQIVSCIVQINPISEQLCYYNLPDNYNIYGQSAQLTNPDLGFYIQGGLIAGPINSLNASQVVSSSLLEEFNIFSLLMNTSQYQIFLAQYSYNGTIEYENLFNISDSYQCQDIEIIEYLIIIVHCTLNGQIVLFNYNQSVIMQQTNITITTNQIVQVNIQSFYVGFYRLYFTYNMQFQSVIYMADLQNNQYSQFQQIWSQNSQFIQIQVTKEQQIYALQFSYLLYQHQNYSIKYPSQNNSNWISMTIHQDFVYLVNNYSIFAGVFQMSSQIMEIQQLPINIQYGQLYSTWKYIILLSSETIIYKLQENQLLLFQTLPSSLQSPLNLFGQEQNFLINFNSSSIQLYQIKDYTVYNQNATQSGILTISYNLQNGSQMNESIYINILPFFSFQIVPVIYQFNGINQSTANIYYVKTDIQQYIGTNLTYSIVNNTIKGSQIITQLAFISQNSYNYQTIYALENLNSLLVIQQQSLTEITFIVDQSELSTLTLSDQLWKQSVNFTDNINTTIFIQQLDCILAVISTDKLLFVYQVQPLISITYLYTINLSQSLNQSSYTIFNYVAIENTVFVQILNGTIIIQIEQSNYQIKDIQFTIVNQVTNSKVKQKYLFMPQGNQFITYLWNQQQLISLQQYTTPLSTYVFPLNCGVYVIEVYLTTYYLYFYDNSMFYSVNLGETLRLNISITSFQFKILLATKSDQFFYIYAKFNDLNYINVYQCTDQSINALYYSILLEDIPFQNYIVPTSNSQLGVDYLSIKVNTTYYLYMIPHKYQIYQFPDFQTDIINNYETTIQINNFLSLQNLIINTTITQDFVQLTSSQMNNINNNLTSGNMSINPYDYFGGANLELYNLMLIQIIEYEQIEINQSSQYSTSYIDQEIQYIYLGGVGNLLQYTLNLSNVDYSDIAQYQKTITVTGASTNIEYSFLELNTNTISWVIIDKSQAYIVSYIKEVNSNISLLNVTQAIQSISYYQGFLQIATENYYFCFNYQIINNTQQLINLISQLPIPQAQEFIASTIVLFNNQTFLQFGMIFQSVANTLQCMMLEINTNNYELLKYQRLDFQVIAQNEFKFPIQSIQQVGIPLYDRDITIINLVYANSIKAGTLQLMFKGLNLIVLDESCQLQMLNTSLQYEFINHIAIFGNQVAIFNIKSTRFGQQLLSLYLVEQDSCKEGQVIYPYSFIAVNDDFLNPLQQVNYLNQNQLLISYSTNTSIYLVNQLLNIQYVTNINSSIQLIAQNPYSYQSTYLDINFTPYIPINNTTPNNTTPNNTTPNNTTPNNTTPNNTTPNNTTPNNTTPNNTTPNNTTPNNTLPNNTIPNNTNPDVIQTTSHGLSWYWYLSIAILIIIMIIILAIILKRKINNDQNQYTQYQNQEIEIRTKQSGLKL